MNIIYFGVSIFALLISTKSYAMEGLEDSFGTPTSESRPRPSNKAIQAYKEALEAKDEDGRVAMRGVERVRTFCYLAYELCKDGRHEEATIYYYKALNAKNGPDCFLLPIKDRKNILSNLSKALSILNRTPEAGEFIQKDADFFHSKNFQKLINAMKEEKIAIDLDLDSQMTPKINHNKNNNDLAVLNKLMQDVKLRRGPNSLSGRRIAQRFEKIGNLLQKIAGENKSKAALLAYEAAFNTVHQKGFQPAFFGDKRAQLLNKIQSIQNGSESKNKATEITRLKSSPPRLRQTRELNQSTQRQLERIRNAIEAAGNPTLALNNCYKLLSTDQALCDVEYADVLWYKGVLLLKVAANAKGRAKQEAYKEALNDLNSAKDLKDTDGNRVLGRENILDLENKIREIKKKLRVVDLTHLPSSEKDKPRGTKRKRASSPSLGTSQEVTHDQQNRISIASLLNPVPEGVPAVESNRMALNYLLNSLDEVVPAFIVDNIPRDDDQKNGRKQSEEASKGEPPSKRRHSNQKDPTP